MAHIDICKDKDPDFFLLETCSMGSREDLLKMGVDMQLLFSGDGTATMDAMNNKMHGTWGDGTMTFDTGDGPLIWRYTIDGDALTVHGDTPEEGDTVYRRSDYDSFESKPTKFGAGETAEVEITDGFVNGALSAKCPDGWYGHAHTMGKSMLIFNKDPDSPYSSGESIRVEYDIKECMTQEGEKNAEISGKIGDFEWEGSLIEEYGRAIMVAYSGGDGIKVTATGVNFEEDTQSFGVIMNSISLNWETRESSLKICEGCDEDYFEIRSMATRSSVGGRSLLTRMGYDWNILFRSDGTVTAKLDRAVTCEWGDGFGAKVSGTWTAEAMQFTNGEITGDLPYTLEGDRLTIAFSDGLPIVFQRSKI